MTPPPKTNLLSSLSLPSSPQPLLGAVVELVEAPDGLLLEARWGAPVLRDELRIIGSQFLLDVALVEAQLGDRALLYGLGVVMRPWASRAAAYTTPGSPRRRRGGCSASSPGTAGTSTRAAAGRTLAAAVYSSRRTRPRRP